ncbi:TIR domain-containing protein [Pedobacter sp. HMF7647]|uniref:TIR domain-containing protein n=1 Tax=Hufsiella arboris TaxID=2695275 RepID=A0A7K1YC69_9SPHI|nr:toll/interleukin-1 receptor domain-containing protein [Hufsiella arboris]MXV51971.1 TIR domain-containing protein [Hufsiella arboris]
MSVFISYSTKDSDFIDKLSIKLIKNKIPIWLDKWEMQPGDSLIEKIQDGLENAEALIVVLSQNSVNSEWCKKELSAGLMRELEEKKVIAIPAVLDDCKVPLFLRDKLYADFRSDFDTGFNNLLRPLSKLFSEHMGRKKDNDIITDYAINWGIDEDLFFLSIDLVNWYEKQRKSILLTINVEANVQGTRRFEEQLSHGVDWLMKETVITLLYENTRLRELDILVQRDSLFRLKVLMRDINSDIDFKIIIKASLMGEDNHNDMLIHLVDYLEMLNDSRKLRLK